jgi:hypothetical protein
MALFLLPRKKLINFSKVQFLLFLLLFVFYQGQKYYYEKKIPGWEKEEKMRKVFFYIHNHPSKMPLPIPLDLERLKQDLIKISFFYDTNLVKYKDIKNFARNEIQKFNMAQGAGFKSVYSLFMDVRIYLFLFSGIAILLAMTRNFKILLRILWMCLFPVSAFIVLMLFAKTTEVIFLAVMASTLLSAFVYFMKTVYSQKLPPVIFYLLALISCFWATIRINKTSNRNKQEISYARSVINELNSHPGVLFINTGKFFDLHLSVWDTPKRYPIYNLVYYDLFFSNSYTFQLNRFGIKDLMKEIPMKNNIYLVGEQAPMLTEYYKVLFNQSVYAEKIAGFHNIEAYQIRCCH